MDIKIRGFIGSIKRSHHKPRHAHASEHRDILQVASKGPIVVYPSSTVKQASSVIVDNGVRRIPVVDPGTKNVVGIMSTRDLIDFFGGGDKYNIIMKDHRGNFLSAINSNISKIMVQDVILAKETASVKDVAGLLLKHNIGGCPIIDKNGKVTAIVSERDLISYMEGSNTGIKVGDCMTRVPLLTLTPGTKLKDACRMMATKGKRRLPVMHEGEVVGMLRGHEVLSYIADGSFSKFKTIDSETILSEPVESIMNEGVVSVTPDQDIGEVASLMKRKRMGGFTVIDDDELVGIITEKDLFKTVY